MTFNSEVMGRRRNTAKNKIFNVSILLSVLKTTAKTHFLILWLKDLHSSAGNSRIYSDASRLVIKFRWSG